MTFGAMTTLWIATVCTITTSVLVIYTANYLIQEHNLTSRKNEIKSKLKKQRLLICNIEKDFSKISTEYDGLTEKEYAEIDYKLTKLLTSLDAVDLVHANYQILEDPNFNEIISQKIKSIASSRKALISEILVSCSRLDSFFNKESFR